MTVSEKIKTIINKIEQKKCNMIWIEKLLRLWLDHQEMLYLDEDEDDLPSISSLEDDEEVKSNPKKTQENRNLKSKP